MKKGKQLPHKKVDSVITSVIIGGAVVSTVGLLMKYSKSRTKTPEAIQPSLGLTGEKTEKKKSQRNPATHIKAIAKTLSLLLRGK